MAIFPSFVRANGGAAVSLTHPLSPNPFPPSPGRKGGPHFAFGVRHRVNREPLKSGLVRDELTPRVPSAGGGVGWGEIGVGLDAGEGVLPRRWRAAASQRVGRHTRTSYDRSRPILPCCNSRDARAVEAFPDRQPSNGAPLSALARVERGGGDRGCVRTILVAPVIAPTP